MNEFINNIFFYYQSYFLKYVSSTNKIKFLMDFSGLLVLHILFAVQLFSQSLFNLICKAAHAWRKQTISLLMIIVFRGQKSKFEVRPSVRPSVSSIHPSLVHLLLNLLDLHIQNFVKATKRPVCGVSN